MEAAAITITAGAIAIAVMGVVAAALLGGQAHRFFKMYSAKAEECEKLKNDKKYLQTIIHARAFGEKPAPGTTNLADAVCAALPCAASAIVVVPPPPPFWSAEVHQSRRPCRKVQAEVQHRLIAITRYQRARLKYAGPFTKPRRNKNGPYQNFKRPKLPH